MNGRKLSQIMKKSSKKTQTHKVWRREFTNRTEELRMQWPQDIIGNFIENLILIFYGWYSRLSSKDVWKN